MNQGPDAYVSQLSASSHDLLRWGPAGDYSSKNSGEYGGLGIAFLNYAGGAILRGNDWADVTGKVGVFATSLAEAATYIDNGNAGFRCAVAGSP